MWSFKISGLLCLIFLVLFARSPKKEADDKFDRPTLVISTIPARGPTYCADWTNEGLSHSGCYEWEWFSANLLTGHPYYHKNTRFKKTRIKEGYLEHLKEWRNIYGRPFSMAALDPNPSLKAKENYSVRFTIGSLIDPSEFYNALIKAKIGYEPEWASKNLSELGAFDGDFLPEIFAWYTAPYYDESLPKPVEGFMEEIINCIQEAACGPENEFLRGPYLKKNFLHFQPYLAEALKNAQGSIDISSEPKKILAAVDDQIFLYILEWQEFHESKWPSIHYSGPRIGNYPPVKDCPYWLICGAYRGK